MQAEFSTHQRTITIALDMETMKSMLYEAGIKRERAYLVRITGSINHKQI